MTTSDRVAQLFAEAGYDLKALYDSGAITKDPAFELLYGAALELASAEETVRSKAAEIKGCMDRVLRYLDEGYHLNSLGELQSRGPAFDVAVAIREARADVWRRAVAAAKRQAEATAASAGE